jgi:hypothetical protein
MKAAPIAESHKARRERLTRCSSCPTIGPFSRGIVKQGLANIVNP